MQKKILLTGASGFLGKYTIEELIANDYQVIGVGRNSEKLASLKKGYQIETAIVNLEQAAEIHEELFECEVEVCIHAAALSTVYGSYEEFYQANVVATRNMIEFCIAKKMRRFIFVSSPSIYAKNQDDFMIKESSIDVKEVRKKYLNNYIRTKVEAECLLQEYMDEIEIVIIRPRGLFGIGDESIFPRLMAVNKKFGIPLLNGGQGNIIDLTCVENVAYALRLCISTPNLDGEIFNITNDEPVEFKELMEKIFTLLNQPLVFKQYHVGQLNLLANLLERGHTFLRLKREPLLTRYTISLLAYSQTLDISLAKKRLGYLPKITIAEGIVQYIENLKKEEERLSE